MKLKKIPINQEKYNPRVDLRPGDPKYLNDSLEATKKPTKAGEILRIKTLDHTVVVQKGYFSFSHQNIL